LVVTSSGAGAAHHGLERAVIELGIVDRWLWRPVQRHVQGGGDIRRKADLDTIGHPDTGRSQRLARIGANQGVKSRIIAKTCCESAKGPRTRQSVCLKHLNLLGHAARLRGVLLLFERHYNEDKSEFRIIAVNSKHFPFAYHIDPVLPYQSPADIRVFQPSSSHGTSLTVWPPSRKNC